MRPIPYSRQEISEDDITEVVRVLRSEWVTQGPAIDRFETVVREYCGATHAVAVCNGTAALHLSCLALGLGAGDLLWTTPNTFVASANCGLYCGADVSFVDIDSRTYNISPDALDEKLRRAEKTNSLPKIVVVVHFAGQSCEMDPIYRLATRYGFRIIEDASHAIGGSYRSKLIGACSYSDITVFSFHPVKTVTTGEGGMILANDERIAEQVRRLRSHGITREIDRLQNRSEGPWYYEEQELGFNYRMTDIQAALGARQMRRLDEFVSRRREIARRYDESFANLPLVTPWQHPDCASPYHLYPIRIDQSICGKDRRAVFEYLRSQKIMANVHYIPVHWQPIYQKRGFGPGEYPQAEKYYREAVSLPVYPGLSKEDQERVIQAVKSALQ